MTQEQIKAALARLSLRISNTQGTQPMFDAMEAEYAALAAQIVPVAGNARRIVQQEREETNVGQTNGTQALPGAPVNQHNYTQADIFDPD